MSTLPLTYREIEEQADAMEQSGESREEIERFVHQQLKLLFAFYTEK